jgi:hypothetical protein
MDFKQAEERFEALKSKFAKGTLSETDFKAQLEELMIQDEKGDWWMIGYETGQWYRNDGNDWVQAEPPGYASKLSAKAQAETERKAKEKATPVEIMPTEMKAEPVSAPPAQKKPVSKGLVIGIVAVVVLVIAGIGISALSKKGSNVPAATQAPANQAPAATQAPANQAPAATQAPANQAPAATEALVNQAPATTEAPAPMASNFQACVDPCNGSNSSYTFESGITKIYIQFDYENIQPGSQYTRTWTNNIDGEWIQYSCAWDGPSSGTETTALSIPGGVRSGTWEMTVMVDNIEVLKESIDVSGTVDYWFPQGLKNTCRLKTS